MEEKKYEISVCSVHESDVFTAYDEQEAIKEAVKWSLDKDCQDLKVDIDLVTEKTIRSYKNGKLVFEHKKEYDYAVYKAVKEYYKENYYKDLTDEDIDEMSKRDVLDAYLMWEGIVGYTSIIAGIFED